MFKVIICGCRDFSDYDLLKIKCNYFFGNKKKEDILIISGGAKGADALGEQYAKENNLKLQIFPADWNLYGKSAGPRRNQEMAKHADGVIAFWDGKSKGTLNMINTAKQQNIKVKIVRY